MARRTSLLWEDTHRRLMDIFRRFGTTSWDCCPLKMEPSGLTETSVYISTQRNIPGEGRFNFNRGGSLKSHIMFRNHNRYLT